MSLLLKRNFIFRAVFVVILGCVILVHSQEECDTNLENMLTALITPNEHPTIQLQALRSELIRRIKEAKQREELENELLQYKRSVSSLARWNNLPGKRNLESLARAGYIRTLPTTTDPDYEGNLLGLRSLRNTQTSADGHVSSYIDAPMYKRNIASLARTGMISGKRNVAALLRQDNYLNGLRENRNVPQNDKSSNEYEEKRNIASIKAQYKPKMKRSTDNGRKKREADYYDLVDDEYQPPIYQNIFDYDDDKNEDEYSNVGKRFLGSVAKSGWFRQPSKFITPNKRHIGSLARLGWLPSLRTARRFNRSGRSTGKCDNRSSTSDGQIDDNSISEIPFQLGGKRFLIQPAVDKILLEKIYMQPKLE